MGFARQGLWVTGYCGLMGYGLQIPAHQLGGPKMAWDFRGYGLSEAWVKRVSTVYRYFARFFFPQLSLSSLTLSVRIPYPYSHTYTNMYIVSSAC